MENEQQNKSLNCIHFICIYFIISMILRYEAVHGVSYTIFSILCFHSKYANDCSGGNPLLPHLQTIACMFLKLLIIYFK